MLSCRWDCKPPMGTKRVRTSANVSIDVAKPVGFDSSSRNHKVQISTNMHIALARSVGFTRLGYTYDIHIVDLSCSFVSILRISLNSWGGGPPGGRTDSSCYSVICSMLRTMLAHVFHCFFLFAPCSFRAFGSSNFSCILRLLLRITGIR